MQVSFKQEVVPIAEDGFNPKAHCTSMLVSLVISIPLTFATAAPPVIKREPAHTIDVAEGNPIVLKVEAECRPGQPLYQWFKGDNGKWTPIVGQDKSTLLIKNASVANSGKTPHCAMLVL